MHRLLTSLSVLALAACPHKAPVDPRPTPPGDAAPRADTPAASTVTPAQRAQQILDAQLAALANEDDSIVATFDVDATVLVPSIKRAHAPNIGLRAAMTRLPPSATLKSVKADTLVAGGNAEAVWWSAELAIEHEDRTINARITELATAATGWKVVAAALSQTDDLWGRASGPPPLDNATQPGPLSSLLGDAAKLSVALDPSVVVYGPGEGMRAQGAAAKQLVGTWTIALENNTIEVRGPSWGYAIGHVQMRVKGEANPVRLTGLVVATPGPNGAWTVVTAHYAAR